MTTPDALLAAIVANPDDDLPRLAYADWLDENGDEVGRARAEYVRVQCEIEPLLAHDDPRLDGLLDREKELWERWYREWDREVVQDLDISRRTYIRGFMESVGTYVHIVGGRTAELFAAAPFRRLESLGILDGKDEPYPGEIAERLANLPQAARLTALIVPENGFDDQDIRILAKSQHLAGLLELDLSRNQLFEPSVLFRNSRLTRLRTLHVADAGLEDDWVTELTECPAAALKRLRKLDLSDNFLTSDGVMTLVECPHLRLERLYLAGIDLDADALSRARERFGADAVWLDPRED